jgi:hypothetical protein
MMWRARRTAIVKLAASAAVLVATVMVAAAPALAQTGPGNPFTPGIPQESATIPSTTPQTATLAATNTSGSSGLSGGTSVAIGVGALVVLGGISFFIWRDARRRAPVRAAAAGAGAGATSGRSGSKARPKPRKLSQAERRRRKRGRAR